MPRERPFCLTLEDIHEVDEDQLERLYSWVDEIPLSRPKKNMGRDFADGVMVAEVIKYFLPKYVELHNYTPANSTKQKEGNWYQLNKKALKRLNLEVSPETIRALAQCKPWVAENFLLVLRNKIDLHMAKDHSGKFPLDPTLDWVSNQNEHSDQPEADQNPQTGYAQYDDYRYNTGTTDRTLMSHAQKPPVPPPQPQAQYQPSHPNQQTVRTQKQSPRITGLKKKPQTEMVPKAVLVEKEKELEERTQTIEILQTKVQRLEHLLQLKDIRIEDLTGRVELMEKQVGIYGNKGLRKGVGPSPRVNPNLVPAPPQAGAGGSYRRWN